MKTYTIISAYLEDGTPISGVPVYQQQTWGQYNSKYPQEAASKAYTNLIKFIKKYRDPWFTGLEDNPPIIVILLDGASKTHIYYVYRETAPQSRSGERIIHNYDGRTRVYQWKNRAIPMKEDETVDDALERYQQRRLAAQQRGTANLH